MSDNGNNWGTTGRTVDVQRMLIDWIEGSGTDNLRGTDNGATWNCAGDSAIQNQSKDCSGATAWEMGQPNNPNVHPWFQTPSATQSITNNQSGVVTYDVTSDVVAFMNGTPDYGWLIKKTNEGQNGRVSFGSRESALHRNWLSPISPESSFNMTVSHGPTIATEEAARPGLAAVPE